jgi:plasmid replication initiation protein
MIIRTLTELSRDRGLSKIWIEPFRGDRQKTPNFGLRQVKANQGRPVNRTVRLTAHDLLVITNRETGGRGYDLLAAAFERLKGTVIQTDIRTNGVRQREGFNIIDHWKIVERNPNNSRMVAIEMTLSEWLYNAAIGREVLTLNRDYFRLAGGLERRLYELARKHCGRQVKWAISLDLLHKKAAARRSSRNSGSCLNARQRTTRCLITAFAMNPKASR